MSPDNLTEDQGKLLLRCAINFGVGYDDGTIETCGRRFVVTHDPRFGTGICTTVEADRWTATVDENMKRELVKRRLEGDREAFERDLALLASTMPP